MTTDYHVNTVLNEYCEIFNTCMYESYSLVSFLQVKLIQLSLLISKIFRISFFQTLKAWTPTRSLLHYSLPFVWSTSPSILRQLVKSSLDDSIYLGPFLKSECGSQLWIQFMSPVKTRPLDIPYNNMMTEQSSECLDQMWLHYSFSDRFLYW